MFLKDIPPELVEAERFNYWQDIYAKGIRNSGDERRPWRTEAARQDGVEIQAQEYDDMLPLGTAVLHDKFGQGVVIGREGSGEKLMVTIRFERVGTKKIMTKYASLEILGR